ncbi:hypothetical protein MKW94_024863 [Papaver nudicaule]|uniref:Uncharacterized protein n=1 Tax=Papaver nudicaule TaxID=74823 RepID=A0AA42B0T4_PAPNU|nr:hypothetical protein [Papaver nudicaule]
MASSSVSPSPTLPLLSPSAISSPSPRKIESLTTPTKFTSQLSSLRWRPSPSPSPPLLSLSSVSSPSPRKIESLLSTPTKSWQQIVSSAFPTPPDCVLSLSSGGGGGSQRKDSPLQSLGSPACNSALSPIRWRPSLSPSPSLSSPSSVLQSPPPPPPPRKPNSFSAPTNSRQGFISSASSTPLSSPTREAAHAKSNGGVGSTPRSAASKERWRRVRDGLEEMQHKWMMNNISQQLKQLNNEATPVITVNGKPNNDINNQEVNQTVSPGQNVERVQEAVQGENVSFDRDGDTIRICYMCCCGRQKQIFFGITN